MCLAFTCLLYIMKNAPQVCMVWVCNHLRQLEELQIQVGKSEHWRPRKKKKQKNKEKTMQYNFSALSAKNSCLIRLEF